MADRARTANLDPKAIDGIFAAIDQTQLPGAAVAVAIDGLPVYRKGFGLANMELPVALGPSMRMRIGSTTKHFVCLAFMLLCEAGLASVDDEVGRHIPELNATNRHVTMRQLMGHTSGLRDVYSITMLFHGTGRPVTDKDLLAYYATIDDIDFEPQTTWSYNNGGYMLLGIAVERIAGEPLADVLRKRIFEPVGMHDTLLRPWDTDFVPNSATLHMLNQQGKYTRDYMGMEITGAGGMVSTMDDMLVWLKHMDAPTVGSAESWATMKAPHRLRNGASTGYGFGLISEVYRGVGTLSHSGGVMGGNSQMIKVPAAGLDISIAANRADVSAVDLTNKIIDAVVEGLDPVPEEVPKAETRDQVFVSPRNGGVVEITTQNDMLLVAIDGPVGMPMSPDSDGVLRRPPAMAFMQQHLIPEGTSIRLVDFGNEDELEPVERNPDAKLGDRAGDYACDPLEVRAILSAGEEGPRLKTVGRHGSADYRLEPITDRIWKASALGPFAMLGFILTFDADGQGFSVRANRMVDLRFRRRS